jgi:transposase
MEVRGEQQVGADHQRCSRCHTIKPLAAFHVNNQTRSGRTSWCKVCRTAYHRKGGQQ